jgi:putative ABC transport system permease protein
MRAFITGIKLALRAVQRNVLRAALTVLGILIGVMAVVAITSLGAGARDSIGERIQSLGANFIVVFPENSAVSGAHGAQGLGKRLTEEDGKAILREAVSVKTLTPWLQAQAQIVYADNNVQTFVGGTTQSFQEVKNWHVDRGEIWTEHDEATKAKVVVLGKTVAKNLFGSGDPIGQMVRIGRYPYRVTGVLAEKGNGPFGGDQDDIALMPIGSMRARVLKTPPGFVGVFLVSSTSAETTDHAVKQMESILVQRHNIPPGRPKDFAIRTLKEFQEIQGTVFNVLTIVLVVIAGISLLVGGIGVMNIMLVSVTERTREIGIRMAIGAREGDIRSQFLIEAVVLTVLGGIAGALLGTAIVSVTASILGWSMTVNPVALTIALVVSGLTGIAFGFFPAYRASKLDPIEALRHE